MSSCRHEAHQRQKDTCSCFRRRASSRNAGDLAIPSNSSTHERALNWMPVVGMRNGPCVAGAFLGPRGPALGGAPRLFRRPRRRQDAGGQPSSQKGTKCLQSHLLCQHCQRVGQAPGSEEVAALAHTHAQVHSPDPGPPLTAFWRLVGGRTSLGHRVDAALAIDIMERAFYAVHHDGVAAFFSATVARYGGAPICA